MEKIINFLEKKKEKEEEIKAMEREKKKQEEERALIERLEQREITEARAKIDIKRASEADILKLIKFLKEKDIDYEIKDIEHIER